MNERRSQSVAEVAAHLRGSVGTRGLRILVLGCPGGGKTTLSRDLCRHLGLEHIELDELYWAPGWTRSERDAFVNNLKHRTDLTDVWLVDGIYEGTEEVVSAQVTHVILLEVPIAVCVTRVLIRSLRRIFSRRRVCNGNIETFWTMLGPRGMLWYSMLEYRRNLKKAEDAYRSVSSEAERIRLSWPLGHF